jgi:hypothetical protein
VPPEKPEIMDDTAKRVVDLRLGPYRVGQNLSLTCTVLGGQCVWFGSIQMSSLQYSKGHERRNFKDTNPLMSSSLVILFGVVKQFGVNLVRNRVYNFCRIWSTEQFRHTLSVYAVHLVWEGGGTSARR